MVVMAEKRTGTAPLLVTWTGRVELAATLRLPKLRVVGVRRREALEEVA